MAKLPQGFKSKSYNSDYALTEILAYGNEKGVEFLDQSPPIPISATISSRKGPINYNMWLKEGFKNEKDLEVVYVLFIMELGICTFRNELSYKPLGNSIISQGIELRRKESETKIIYKAC